jgi:hypothetical protein
MVCVTCNLTVTLSLSPVCRVCVAVTRVWPILFLMI